MYELANPVRIKDVPVFNTEPFIRMTKDYIFAAYQNGVNIGELAINSYIYELDDIIASIEYTKMLCNLVKIFRNIYDSNLYTLRLQRYINDQVYSMINFHNIFNEVNTKFNMYIVDSFLFEEVSIYHSEISLETSIDLYEVFNDNLISALKDFVDPNLLKFIFNKISIKYIQNIHNEVMIQLENVFLIY